MAYKIFIKLEVFYAENKSVMPTKYNKFNVADFMEWVTCGRARYVHSFSCGMFWRKCGKTIAEIKKCCPVQGNVRCLQTMILQANITITIHCAVSERRYKTMTQQRLISIDENDWNIEEAPYLLLRPKYSRFFHTFEGCKICRTVLAPLRLRYRRPSFGTRTGLVAGARSPRTKRQTKFTRNSYRRHRII